MQTHPGRRDHAPRTVDVSNIGRLLPSPPWIHNPEDDNPLGLTPIHDDVMSQHKLTDIRGTPIYRMTEVGKVT